jgi:hypothetical protein
VQRHTTDLTGSNARTELVYALSSQPAHHASPQQLGALARAHWQVEALHWVRDVTFAKTPAASAPPRPPGHGHLRNLAIGLLRLAGHTQITPTLRWVNRNPARALAFSASHEPANTPNPITPRPDGGNLRPREMFSLGVTKEREPSQPRALK